jgi:hypothetical protein
MENKFNSIEYKTIIYKLNNESCKFEKQPTLVPFEKLPFELKVETTRDQNIRRNGATEIITGRIKGGKRLFFTGLIHVGRWENWFLGNDYQFTNGKKKNSLVIFNTLDNNRELVVYYFNSFYKDSPEERRKFVLDFIMSVQ